jgi:hypothetical protein
MSAAEMPFEVFSPPTLHEFWVDEGVITPRVTAVLADFYGCIESKALPIRPDATIASETAALLEVLPYRQIRYDRIGSLTASYMSAYDIPFGSDEEWNRDGCVSNRKPVVRIETKLVAKALVDYESAAPQALYAPDVISAIDALADRHAVTIPTEIPLFDAAVLMGVDGIRQQSKLINHRPGYRYNEQQVAEIRRKIGAVFQSEAAKGNVHIKGYTRAVTPELPILKSGEMALVLGSTIESAATIARLAIMRNLVMEICQPPQTA